MGKHGREFGWGDPERGGAEGGVNVQNSTAAKPLEKFAEGYDKTC